MASAGLRREGFLIKEGKFFKSWRSRWFELWDDRLVYFEDRDSLKELGTIELRDILAVKALSGMEVAALERIGEEEEPNSARPKHHSTPNNLNTPHLEAFRQSSPVQAGSESQADLLSSGPQRQSSRASKEEEKVDVEKTFCVETSERVYRLRAESEAVMVEWIQALRAERERNCKSLERARQRASSFGGAVPVGREFFKYVVEKEEAAQLSTSVARFVEFAQRQEVTKYPMYIAEGTAKFPPNAIATIRFPNNAGVESVMVNFKVHEKLELLIAEAIKKYAKIKQIDAGTNPATLMFKVTGRADYLYGDRKAVEFEYIRSSLAHHTNPDLVLTHLPSDINEESLRKMEEEMKKRLRESEQLQGMENCAVSLQSNPKHTPITDVKRNFKYKLVCARQLSLDSPSFSRARAMAEAAGAGLCCRVESVLALGDDLLCPPQWSKPFPGRLSVKFDCWVEFPVPVCNLPRGTKLCITLHGGVSATRVQVPLAWINVQLFNHRGVLRSKGLSLKMWLNDKANPLATCQQNTDLSKPPPTLELAFEPSPVPILWVDTSQEEAKVDYQPLGFDLVVGNEEEFNDKTIQLLGPEVTPQSDLQQLANQDMLYTLSDEDKQSLWQKREFCVGIPLSLSKLLRAVTWTDRQKVATMIVLLRHWPKLAVRDAIELLDAKYAEQCVRDYAVQCLTSVSDSTLAELLPQLVQAIKHEMYHSSALARFLFARSLQSPARIGHSFFWQLKAELHNVVIRERYGVLLSSYLEGCAEELRLEYTHQTDIIQSLMEIAKMVKSLPKQQRTPALQSFLTSLRVPASFALPISSKLRVKGFIVDKCKCMQSATVPLRLVFENADPHGAPVYIIFKVGDDLRQDILTLQMFQIMDRIWCDNGLDLSMTLYSCVAVGDEAGIIEVVTESETVADISRNHRQGSKLSSALAAFKHSPLMEWLRAHNPNPDDFAKARDRFTRSCAAYCVATYVLGIGDRHNDNVMIRHNGNLFHIDFGHFLGNFQKFLGLNRDRAPFVFTPDFAYVIGGKESDEFQQFVRYCTRAYNMLRKHSRVFVNLFGLMLSTGIPELNRPEDLNFLKHTLCIGQTDIEAASKFEKLIHASLNARSTQVNNAIHILAN